MIPAPIETDRLLLVPAMLDGLDDFHRLNVEPAVRRYLWDDIEISRERASEVLTQSAGAMERGEYGLWTAALRDETGLIGYTGFWPFSDPNDAELMYALHESFWGRGLATEMAAAMLDYGFSVHSYAHVHASADAKNASSIAVMKRLGMRYERNADVDGGDTVFYGIGAGERS